MTSAILLLAQMCVSLNPSQEGEEVEMEGGGTFRLGLDALGRNGQPSCLEDSLVKATFWSGEEDELCHCWAALMCMQYARYVGVAKGEGGRGLAPQ